MIAPQHHMKCAGLNDYWQLLKPRVMSLVIFTGLCGILLAPGRIHPFVGFLAILSLAVGAGAAGCLNIWWERDTDALMDRTKNRAVPAGRIDPNSALTFGAVLAIGSVAVMVIAVNILAAMLLAGTILFYVCVYTIFLKPRTPQNIVIGGISGALPPVIGWAAVSNSAPIEAWILFLIIFLWTPAHFWSLCIQCQDDYKKAGIPMLPCVFGDQSTKKQIMLYSVLTVLSSYLPYHYQMASSIYLVSAIVLGMIFIAMGVRFYYQKETNLQLFAFSIFYLFGLFLALLTQN
ncbi:MAG: heme o synthase [Alphaproteobacteria bacterium]|nr:heme o synthase [Alphaproteobacteria bacterium]